MDQVFQDKLPHSSMFKLFWLRRVPDEALVAVGNGDHSVAEVGLPRRPLRNELYLKMTRVQFLRVEGIYE